MPFTVNSTNSITISSSSSEPFMTTHQRFILNRPQNRIQFETHIDSSTFNVGGVNVFRQDYHQAQNNGLGTIAVNNGSLYGADLYFEDVEGIKVLKINVKTWSGMASFSNSSPNDVVYVESSTFVATTSTVHINASELNNIPASELLNYIRGRQDHERLYDLLLELAEMNGVEVPTKYREFPKHVPSTNISDRSSTKVFPLLGYLMYPMLREVDSISVCVNSVGFETYWRQYGQLGYRNFVEKAFGKVTSKLLKELWDFIVDGKEPEAEEESNDVALIDSANTYTYTIKIPTPYGTRKFSSEKFRCALVIYKAFGFDYLYQLISYSKNSDERNSEPTIILGGPYGDYGSSNRTDIHQDALLELSKYYDKGKVTRMYWEGHNGILDALNMLRELTVPGFIPDSLVPYLGNPYNVPKCKSIQELHDKLSRDITSVKAEKNNKPIQLYPWEESLDGLSDGDLNFVVARKTRQLAEWGSDLKICIASYDTKALNKKCTLVGIEKNGKLVYAMELKSIVEKSDTIPMLDGVMTEEEYMDKYGNRFELNFVFWEQDKVIREMNGYGSGDQAGIHQLVQEYNKALPKEEYDRVSKLVYEWYERSRKEVMIWLRRLPKEEQPIPETQVGEGTTYSMLEAALPT